MARQVRGYGNLKGPLEELNAAALDRMKDAEVLLEGGRFGSAIAMGLYALEIALKSAICRRLDLDSLPEPFFIHDLNELLILSGLSKKIRRIKRPFMVTRYWDDLSQLAGNLDRFRYSSDPSWDETLARKVLHQLRDQPNGVLPWLAKQR